MRRLLLVLVLPSCASTVTDNPERPAALYGVWEWAYSTYSSNEHQNRTKVITLDDSAAIYVSAYTTQPNKWTTPITVSSDTVRYVRWALSQDSTTGVAILCLHRDGFGRQNCFRTEQVADTLRLSDFETTYHFTRSPAPGDR